LDLKGRKWREVWEEYIMSFITMHTKFSSEEVKGGRPRIRPRHRWDDNITMDRREIGLKFVDWIHLAQDRDRWRALVIIPVSYNLGNF
jgi:hypothetical protein